MANGQGVDQSILGSDPIARALQRRRGGQPAPALQQMSAAAPGQAPPQPPALSPQPSPSDVAGVPGAPAPVEAGVGGPVVSNPEMEIILKAMASRAKTISKIEEASAVPQTPAPAPATTPSPTG